MRTIPYKITVMKSALQWIPEKIPGAPVSSHWRVAGAV